MLLTGGHLRALDVLLAREAAGHGGHPVQGSEYDIYRVLEVQGLARAEIGHAFAATYIAREIAQLLERMREQGVLRDSNDIEGEWRFLGSEVVAALLAAVRAGDRVGPVTDAMLRERGLASRVRDRDRKITEVRLNQHGRAWLEYDRRVQPRLEITAELANSIHDLPTTYADTHELRLSRAHVQQLEAMRLLVWAVPDRQVFALTAAGNAVHEALSKGGSRIEDTVLDDAILAILATLEASGTSAVTKEELMAVQISGYVGPAGELLPAGQAALRARRYLLAEPTRHLKAIAVSRQEVELLATVRTLSQEPEGKRQSVTKALIQQRMVGDQDKRYQAFVGKYGRRMEEVPARKRQAQQMVAELRERDSVYGRPDAFDEWAVHLEAFDLLRREGEGGATVFRLLPNGERVLHLEGDTPRTITSMGVKAVAISTTAGHRYAPSSAWVERAVDEELLGTAGITDAGRFFAWLARSARRWPVLARAEAETLLNLPEIGPVQDVAPNRRHPGHASADAERREHALDQLEAYGLFERLVDGQLVRTEAGRLLTQAVAGATGLAHPISPAIVRLLDAVRQVGKSLYVKEEKVRTEPRQWEDVERLTALAPVEFKETLHLARSGKYLGEAGLTEAGRDVLRALDALNVAVDVQ